MSTQKVEYVGPFDNDPNTGFAVRVSFSDGRRFDVRKGEPLEVADDYAAQLLRQTDNWKPAAAKSTPKKQED